MKNRNRQEAAKKRVRDNNGKFTGGLLLWKPQYLFKTEKQVNSQASNSSNKSQMQDFIVKSDNAMTFESEKH